MISFQDFSILCWNVRGAVNTAGRRHTRELVRKHHPSIVMLMETHCTFSRAERFWNKLGYEAGAYFEAQGHSGGIWILVEKGRDFTSSVVDCFHQIVTISIKKGAHIWWCSAVYASPIPSIRDQLWEHLGTLRALVQGPWLLMENFNEILLPSEVRGGTFNMRRAQKLGAAMDNCGLLDLGATGHFFTWTKRANGVPPMSKRLDRAIADCEWRNRFPKAFVENLFRHQSDHSHMLLRCNGEVPSKKDRPFRFQASWLTHKDFPQMVQKAWRNGHNLVPTCLSRVQRDAQEFNSKVFGNIFKRKRALESRLWGIQRTLEHTEILNLAMLEKDIHKEYNEVLKQEELLWYKKSREKWVKLGDRNTTFFHILKLLLDAKGTKSKDCILRTIHGASTLTL